MGRSDLAVASFDAQCFDGIRGRAQSSGVDEAEEYSLDIEYIFDGITGSPMDVTHDRALFTKQGIEQGTLTDVGRSCDRHGDTLLDRITETEAVGESFDLAGQFVK